MSETYLEIFRQLNAVPRPSHHEEKVADFLCRFAEKHGLRYRRDAQNCVVIEKDATPGHENAEPVVILNHMDMVCVARDGYLRDGRPFDPLNDEIRPYVETVKNPDGTESRWMKAEGTSLGADNGMGLSMALAVLADDSIVHGPLEVLTTTNEEDGMSGAEGLSADFIRGRKVINLDSEAYDEITVGAAGAYIQIAGWKAVRRPVPDGYVTFRILLNGGLGGHSGVDINKGRCNANYELCTFLMTDCGQCLADGGMLVCSIAGGTANASISPVAEVVVAVKEMLADSLRDTVSEWNKTLVSKYSDTDPDIRAGIGSCDSDGTCLVNGPELIKAVSALPYGVVAMRDDMPGTVMTSNNIGVIATTDDMLTVSCHTRSFSDDDMHRLGADIAEVFRENGSSEVRLLMDTPAWMEREDSPLLALTCSTFNDVLGFEPRKVAMHFVLEAAYYVRKYPGVEIASIGPLIIEPHSTSERVSLDTADDIWKVTVELLRRLSA
ncbi:MAG: beta-Ala-His dipeptidase [Bacteroidaceae bacterium]|nr:beta-Ala-His dipeptidase [Bacteroidaceae bacterium]